MKNKISIIVPVYNAEKYISECIDSVLNQTYKNYELILIDDGSTDNSLKILNKYKNKNSKLKVFHQENCGVSKTRNLGISLAEGDFLIFLDSDDKIKYNMLSNMMKIQNKEDADLVQCNLEYIYNNKKSILYNNVKNMIIKNNFDQVKQSIISINYLMKNCKGIYGPVRCIGGKLYKTDLIKKNNLKFDENLYILEDGIFNFSYYESVKKIVIIDEALYEYRQIETSTTYRYNKDQLKQYQIINKYFKKFNNRKYNLSFNLNCFELISTYIYREFKYKKMSYKEYRNFVKETFYIDEYRNAIKYLKYRNLNFRENIKLFCFKNNTYFLLYLLTKLR